ncbi:UNVERIFIED_CONTAM: hypothetical protein HDU68_000515 [Siphonaria sp. JEL0065]|nr:hypothetical protein HDU68_000515 [Siphonaria sp. JEL0065]
MVPQQTHYLRHFSASLFVALFAFFSFHVVVFAFQQTQKQIPHNSTALCIAFALALYFSLIPAAVCHGCLSAVASVFMDQLAQFQPESETPAAPNLPDEHTEPDSSLISTIKVSTLGVPAISHAVANVVTRLILQTGGKLIVKLSSCIPQVLDFLASCIQSFVNLLHRTLPKLYPYLETGVLFVVKWSPIVYERIETGTTVALRSVYSVCVYTGKLIHDSWDPVILPVFGYLGSLAHALYVQMAVGFHYAKDFCYKGILVCHDVLEYGGLRFLVFGAWFVTLSTPYFMRAKEIVLRLYGDLVIFGVKTLDLVHWLGERAAHYFVEWKVPEILHACFIASIKVWETLVSWGHLFARWTHSVLEFVFTLIHNSKILKTLWFSVQCGITFITPIILQLSHNVYIFSTEIIAQTKKLALPLIQYMTVFSSYCFMLSFKYANIVATTIMETEWYKMVQQVMEWQVWTWISMEVGIVVTEVQAKVRKVVGEVQAVAEKVVSRVYMQVEQGVSEALNGSIKKDNGWENGKAGDSTEKHKFE